MDEQPTDGTIVGASPATDDENGHGNGAAPAQERIPVFGARKKARELAGEVARLRGELDRLGVLSVVELEQRRSTLAAEIETETARLEQERRDAAGRRRREMGELDEQRRDLETRVGELRTQVVQTEELAILQEVGVYEYRHPLSDAVAYQAELERLRDQIKAMAKKDGGAVQRTTNWTVNSSAAQGRKMVRDFSKLMLRAYNAEADNLVRGLKPYKLTPPIERLEKVADDHRAARQDDGHPHLERLSRGCAFASWS